jgi:hypothetical protein
VRGEFPDQTKGRGREGIGDLRDGNGQGNHSLHVVFAEFELSNERRKDVALPILTPNRTTPRKSSGTLGPRRE